MDITGLKKTLPICIEAGITPLIIGHHGTGKSESVKQFADENGYDFFDLRLGQMESSGDIIGLADFETDEDGNKIATKFMPPSYLPRGGKGILFLDEINRATKDILQAVFQLVLDRKVNEYTLPEGWAIVAASNPPTDDYTVNDFADKAFQDRFCHIRFEPTVDEWLKYATSKNVDDRLVSFISENEGFLEVTSLESFSLDYVKPSRRSNMAFARVLAQSPSNALLKAIGLGLIGNEAITSFFTHIEAYESLVTPEEVLKSFTKVSKKIDNNRIDMVKRISDNLVEYLKENDIKGKQITNLEKFVLHVNRDLAYSLMRDLYDIPKLIENQEVIEKIYNSEAIGKYFDDLSKKEEE